jgi:hypothetical protein
MPLGRFMEQSILLLWRTVLAIRRQGKALQHVYGLRFEERYAFHHRNDAGLF